MPDEEIIEDGQPTPVGDRLPNTGSTLPEPVGVPAVRITIGGAATLLRGGRVDLAPDTLPESEPGGAFFNRIDQDT